MLKGPAHHEWCHQWADTLCLSVCLSICGAEVWARVLHILITILSQLPAPLQIFLQGHFLEEYWYACET